MSNYDEINDTLEELCKYCSSDELTLPGLQEKMKKLDQFPLHDVQEVYALRPFLHHLCLSKMVSMEIVEYILDKYPEAATVESGEPGYVGSIETMIMNTFPLHLACYNQYCPSSIIKLLLERCPAAFRHHVQIGNVFRCEYYSEAQEGLPLHYYVARKTNVDIDIVKMLIEAYPQALQATDGVGFTPLHAIVSSENENINDLLHIIQYLIEVEPTCVRTVDQHGRAPLHVACQSGGITLEIVRLLVNEWPEAISTRERNGFTPIHDLCNNYYLDDETALDILRLLINNDLNLAREMVDDEDYLPIHIAATGKSTAFCKVLIDADPESVRIEGGYNSLPIHIACDDNIRADAVDTIQYMLDLYPESMDAFDIESLTPFHKAAQGKRVDIVELLLKHDPDAASKPLTNSDNFENVASYDLPLHSACAYSTCNVEVAEVLFDAYPQAIYTHNRRGETPLDVLWETAGRNGRDPNESKVVNFLLTQQAYYQQAQDIKAKTTIDKNDLLSLCCALKDKAPLGSIKLLVGALRSIGHTESLPLNTACEFSSVKVVRYLLRLAEERLSSLRLVHSACRGGNLEVIKYFLDEHISLVSSAEVNENGELPIHLLCGVGKDKVDIESAEYIEIIWRMLLANPEAVLGA